jgi:hypothetical protein
MQKSPMKQNGDNLSDKAIANIKGGSSVGGTKTAFGCKRVKQIHEVNSMKFRFIYSWSNGKSFKPSNTSYNIHVKKKHLICSAHPNFHYIF